jgi:carboxyl-terminal processing protease
LPPQPVWFESKRLGNAGYIRFNMFLDLVHVMQEFGEAVRQCAHCDGIVIDLRGNPGGIGGMAMGMAGWLVSQPGQRLGTMYMRGATLNFFINPRAEAYDGPVVVLVDGVPPPLRDLRRGPRRIPACALVPGCGGATLGDHAVAQWRRFPICGRKHISTGGQALEANGVVPDVSADARDVAGRHDAVVDAALD